MVPRRVVTGHAADGSSVVVCDGPVPVSKEITEVGVSFHEIWSTSQVPVTISPTFDVDPASLELTVPPPLGGTKIRINEFQPGHLDADGRQSPMHRTATVDYGIVLEGEIVLLVDEGEVTLHAGDVVVQRGTNHAWANRSESPARVAFLMLDATFEPGLRDVLPGDEVTPAPRRFDG